MKKFWKILGGVVSVIFLVAVYMGYRIGFGQPFKINQLANRQALLFVIRDPEVFTEVGVIDGTLLDGHSGKLTDISVPKRDADYAQAQQFVSQVKQFDRGKLALQDQITYDVLLDGYETALSFKRFDWLSAAGLYPLTPFWGVPSQLSNFLETQHVIKNEKMARNYVKRLLATGPLLDMATGEMQRQAALGVVMPISLLEKSEVGIRDATATSPDQNPLVLTFVERMKKLGKLPAELQRTLTQDAAAAVQSQIYPAYARMMTALEAQRPAATSTAAGVGRLPDGAAYYAAALQQMTTTDYTPDQVHQLGLDEVTRITAELDMLLKAQGMASGSVGVRVQALHKDPRFLLPNTDEGRQQLLTRYQQILDDVDALMPTYFASVPTAKLQVVRVPTATEKGAAGAYYAPAALDGSRPGMFNVNLREVTETATWTMKTLAYHEGIPGHHFQIATAQSLKDLPLIRQEGIYAAYAEGWALYAERLAAEIGMYKDDPFGDIGRLEAEIFRAARLVVDTGIHAQGWTREQAIQYMVETTGMNESEVVSEVERYMGMPGQACAYKVGQLKILALRDHAKTELGPRFNLKDFHAVVLGSGGVPLKVLETLVEDWIARAKG